MSKTGIEYLRKKLSMHSNRVDMRYKQYSMKYNDPSVGITIPPEIRARYRAVLGWCAKGVDSLADRLVFREFQNDDFEVNEIFDANNPDIFFDSVVLSSLIASCAFVYLSNDENEQVRLQVIEASNATGVLDPITGLLTEGYAVLERDEEGKPKIEAYFIPGKTEYYVDGKYQTSILNNVAYPLLVPVIHRPDAVRPFGRSRITRAGMYYQKYAKRTLERADVTAEFYSFPQKYVLGLSNEAEPLDSWKATVSSMLQFTKDDEGDSPKLGQFTTSNMSPFTEQLKTAAAGFAGESGLTLDDLGFVSDNPSSVEAIKASHENLRLAGRKAQRSLGTGLLNVAYIAACLRDNFTYNRSLFVKTKPKWEPLFEADASTLTMIGDGAIKLNQAIPGFVDGETIRDLTGVKGADV
ncbi:phage portal protein [Vagococcus xieshaowenii]|uniref:Phage portal protein n=1 Tax=Vagococcus xieshaowenii TaxID=2562451 RepID=A0AAJ5EFD6_9ENTE|nr:phage portal protein [Vagococcus xieshaowenii]QCA28245.1 phage portal protein [Vagococcus xieshaowenii]TFZ41899.1 phage portal protein [Vagococcus xieshaowenii]